MHEIEGFLLAPQQRRLLQKGTRETAGFILEVTNGEDWDQLTSRVSQLVEEHEILRTRYAALGHPPQVLQIIEENLTRWETPQPFDPTDTDRYFPPAEGLVDQQEGPCLHICPLQAADGRRFLRFTMPALSLDPSTPALIARLLSQGSAPDDEALQYADYCDWLDEKLEAEKEQARNNFFHILNDAPPVGRPPYWGEGHGEQRVHLYRFPDPEIRTRLDELGAQTGHFLLTNWTLFLSRLTGQLSTAVGVHVPGRDFDELKHTPGFVDQSLTLVSTVDPQTSFSAFLKKQSRALEEHARFQGVWFPELLKEHVTPDIGFQWVAPSAEKAATFRLFASRVQSYEHPLVLSVEPLDAGLCFRLAYEESYLSEASANRLLDGFLSLLTQTLHTPDQPIHRYGFTDPEERRYLTHDFNNKGPQEPELPGRHCIHQLFEQQVARHGDQLAVFYEGTTLTYDQLNRKANRLAHYLRERGVGPEVIVGLCMSRGVEMIVALMAVFKAGGAYLPLDPENPSDRLRTIVSDSGCRHLIVRGDHQGPGWPAHTVMAQYPDTNPNNRTHPDNLAYVIYTSGSTGTPKGVQVRHHCPVNLLAGLKELVYPGTAEHGLRVGVNAPLSFDASMQQIVTLTTGHSLYIIPQETRMDGKALVKYLNDHALDILDCTPTHLAVMVGAGLLESEGPLPARVQVAGGAIEPALWNKLARAQRTRFFDIYGPTECTVDATGCLIDQVDITPSIGGPLLNYQIYLVDQYLQLVPWGVPGELLIGGHGLARGYLSRPGLTACAFIPHPFCEQPGQRLYRSGDQARFLSDGRLAFIGRMDDQVKLRGFRIELGEVEAAVRDVVSVEDAVAVARELPGAGGKQLVAYYIGGADPAHLRDILEARLPEYMVPTHFIPMDAFPLKASGKLDKKALPDPHSLLSARPHKAPSTTSEEMLSTIWKALLGHENISVDDNFFDLGGHSLLAIQLITRIHETFLFKLPLRETFEYPTIESLAAYLDRQTQESRLPPMEIAPLEARSSLSFAQQRMWLLHQLVGENATYHLPSAMTLSGVFQVTALEQALADIADRHEVLRTTFSTENDLPIQVVHDELPLKVTLTDLTSCALEQQADLVEKIVAQAAQMSFDLERGPLIRVHVLRLSPLEHVLSVTMHHLVSDGWSLNVWFDEIAQLYRAHVTDGTSQLELLSYQYTDYAHWQRGWLQGGELERQLAYWRKTLEGAPALLEMPWDYGRPSLQTFNGANVRFSIPKELVDTLEQQGRARGLTLFMAMEAVLAVLLSRFSNQDTVMVGTPVANRSLKEIEPLIGFFANTLVLKNDLSGSPTFNQLQDRLRHAALDAYNHQDIPFEQIVEGLKIERNLGFSPLFQIMYVLLKQPSVDMNLPGLELSPLRIENVTAKFDLLLFLMETETGLDATLEYNTDLFKKATIERISSCFQVLLRGIADNPDQYIHLLPLISEGERKQALFDWNDTATPFSDQQTLHGLFEKQAALTPNAPAVFAGEDRLSYGTLNKRANRIAHDLLRRGIGQGDFVAVCFHRRIQLAEGLLGILKTGAAYVPMDPIFPVERMHYILKDIEARFYLAHEDIVTAMGETEAEPLVIQDDRLRGLSEENPALPVPSDQLAYIIFTSGSTGRPKGVILQHRPVVNLIEWVNQSYQVGPGDRVLFTTSLCFDLSVYDVFGILAAGAEVYIASEEQIRNPELLMSALNEDQITFWDSAPATLLQLVPFLPEQGQGSKALRICFLSGDWIPLSLPPAMQAAFPNVQVVGLGGATEAAIWSNFFNIHQLDPQWKSVPYGMPLQNAHYHVLNSMLEPCPIGVAGDLYIGADCLSRGYFHQPGLSASRYIPDPFSRRPGMVLYNTGDRAGRMPDGNIEFLGRLDAQVKIRGFRIELGEIESVLKEQTGVREAVAIVREDRPGDRRIVAYLLVEDDGPFEVTPLRTSLAERVPDYMVPSAFVVLEQFPLTSNGKLDRKALPAPDTTRGEGAEEAFVAPRDAMEKTIAALWREVLGIDQVSIFDDFFEAGGHSLVATQLMMRIRAQFDLEMPLRVLFEYPTIAGLAEQVHGAASAHGKEPPLEPVSRAGDLPLSYAQRRLWFLDRLYANNVAYSIPLVMAVKGDFKPKIMEAVIHEVVARHEILRTTYDERDGEPVQIIGSVDRHPMKYVDLRHEPNPGDAAHTWLEAEARTPFDLKNGPILRSAALQLEARVYTLIINVHHIAFDGWSMDVLLEEIRSLYAVFQAGEPSPLKPLSIQYCDFTHWQLADSDGAAGQYWLAQMADCPTLDLHVDGLRPSSQDFSGQRHPLPPAGRHLEQQLLDLAHQEGTTMFNVLLAAFKLLLFRYTDQTDLVVGAPFANRKRKELEGMIGFFVNTLPLRTGFDPRGSFHDLLGAVAKTSLDAQSHQDYPFEKLVDELRLERDPGRTPLYQVVFNYQQLKPEQLLLAEGLQVDIVPITTGTSKFDLTLNVIETGAGIQGSIEYNPLIFGHPTIEALADHYSQLLESIATDPGRRLSALPMLSNEEQRILANGYHGQREPIHFQAPKTAGRLIHQRFEAQVEQHGRHQAVCYEDARLDYVHLNQEANRIAHYLRQRGVGAEVRVGLCLERSNRLIACILGVLKAGGVYVPLDPGYPEERLNFIAQDAGMAMILCDEQSIERVPSHLGIIPNEALVHEQPDSNPDVSISSINGAYMIYTSGSTGKPKGVLVPHQNVIRLFEATHQWFNFDQNDVWTLFHSYAFDFSVWEIWGALFYGARLVVVPYWVSRDSRAFYQLLCKEQVTVLNQSPSAFRQLVYLQEHEDITQAHKHHLRYVIFGAEALDVNALEPWLRANPATRLVNMYGITETTVHVTYRQVGLSDLNHGQDSPIGVAIPDLSLYVLDRELRVAPIGVPGEIFVGGGGPARGYFKRPALTAERFVPNPYAQEPGERLYRSGDRARVFSGGQLAFLGRADHQVKIRGFRIEPGEIQAHLGDHEDVGQNVVLNKPDKDGRDRLVGYVIPAPGRTPDQESLREFLLETLPDYMVPAGFVFLSSFPMTAHGKLDRRALPDLTVEASRESYAAPTNALEETLAVVWQEALERDKISIHDNFFSLGGDSILSVRLLAIARKKGLVFDLQQLFTHQTIASLAAVIAGGCATDPSATQMETTQPFQLIDPALRAKLPAHVEDAYPMSKLQVGMIYHMELEPEMLPYHNVDSWVFKGKMDREALTTAVKYLVQRHPILRTGLHLSTYGQPLQLVHREAQLELVWEDLRGLSEAEQDALAHEYVVKERKRAFVLTQPTLLRFAVHLLDEDLYRFSVTECHAILDGWSLHQIFSQLFQFFFKLLDARPVQAEPLPFAYRDFINLETAALANQSFRAFWGEKLSRFQPLVLPVIPWDQEADAGKIIKSEWVIEPLQYQQLKVFAESAGVPLKTVLLAAHLKVLAMMTGREDIVTGLASHGRPEVDDGERVCGLFLNILPFRHTLARGSWKQVVAELFKAEQEVIPYRRFPSAELQNMFGGVTLFNTLFNYVHFHSMAWVLEADLLEEVPGRNFTEEPNVYPLQPTFSVDPTGERILVTLQSSGEEGMGPQQVDAVAGYYQQVLAHMTSSDEAGPWSTSFIPKGEYGLTPSFAVSPQDLAGRLGVFATRNPIEHTEQAVLLDQDQHPVPVGTVGEVCFQGPPTRRSGLLARRMPDGALVWEDLFDQRRERYLSGPHDAELAAFWQRYLAGAPMSVSLPTDEQKTSASSPGAHDHAFSHVPGERLNRREHAMTFLSAFATLLYRISGQREMVIMVPLFNGDSQAREGLRGGILNLLPLRLDFSEYTCFNDLKTSADDQWNRLCPFGSLPMTRSDQFASMMDTDSAPKLLYCYRKGNDIVHIPGLKGGLDQLDSEYHLALVINEQDDGLLFHLIGLKDLFHTKTLENLANWLETILTHMAEDTQTALDGFPILTEAEKQQVLHEAIGTYQERPDRCMHQLFEDQVKRTPDAVALTYVSNHGEVSYTYSRLNAYANRIAHHLAGKGVAPDTMVGLYLDKTADFVAALLGVMKCGAAYLPIDTSYPQNRVSFMLQDTRAAHILTHEKHLAALPGEASLFCLDQQAALLKEASSENPEKLVSPQQTAYVIYTSGSTGTPKGVLVPHYGQGNLWLAARKKFAPGQGDRVLQFSSTSFDASILELHMGLFFGATLYIAPRELILPGDDLTLFLRKYRITIAMLVPSALTLLAAEGFPELRIMISAGEAPPPGLLAQWAKHVQVYNGYGPTETTVVVTLGKCRPEDYVPPLGEALPNCGFYILDRRLNPVPPGVPGALYIENHGVTRGYHQRPGLTAASFVPHPFSTQPGARLYLSGDLVKYRGDGQLEYLGRIDHQVKIRGYRIEIGEIESWIARHPAVAENVLLVREDVPGDKRLVSYIRPHQHQQPFSMGDLHQFLSDNMPSYMLPSAFVVMETFPLLPNGKLNKTALPRPEDSHVAGEGPRNEVEAALVRMWCDLLGLDNAGIHDNFFELGGHSLSATQLVSRIKDQLKVNLPLRNLFESPTPEGLGLHIAELQTRREQLDRPTIEPVDRNQPMPLSYAQERLWFLDKLNPGESSYNIPVAYRVVGDLDEDAFRRSFEEIRNRHEALRTHFVEVGGNPTQQVEAPCPLEMEVVDLGGQPADQQEEACLAAIALRAVKPFDLRHDNLMRLHLFRLQPREWIFLLNIHHIVSDGWSQNVLEREFSQLYEAFSNGRPSPLEPLSIQYPDFASWQRQWLMGDVIERQLHYWKNQLTGSNRLLHLPTDRPRPPLQTSRGNTLRFQLDTSVTQAMNALCDQQRVTPFMALMGAFAALLSRYTGARDLNIGTPVANRGLSQIEPLIGFFVNTLVMRLDLSGDPDFPELLDRIRHTALDAYSHQDLPFEQVVEHLQPDRNLHATPLFQTLFTVQEIKPSGGNRQSSGVSIQALEFEAPVAKFDLSLVMVVGGETTGGMLNYNTDLFDETSIEQLIDRFRDFCSTLFTRPACKPTRLSLLAEGERHKLLDTWNQTRLDIPQHDFVTLFQQRVAQTPDAPALVEITDQDPKTLTYKELDRQSNRLAHYLRQRGVNSRDLVGMALGRTLDYPIAVLGILKAGAPYVPLDPTYPKNRLSFMIEDSGLNVVVTSSQRYEDLPFEGQAICLDRDQAEINAQPETDPNRSISTDQLAYVIYTSGSTGRPKGVLVTHQGIGKVAHIHSSVYKAGPGSRVLQFSSSSFDAAVFELVMSLLTGATLYLAHRDKLIPGEEFSTLLTTHEITHITLPPSALNHLDPARFPKIELVVSAGEAARSGLLGEWAEGRQVYNAYGPTEATIFVSQALCRPGEMSPPIGHPLCNTRIYILDPHLEPCPIGIPGELFAGGVGLARGYHQRPALTAERFLPDPFTTIPGSRLYRTGDLSRYREDGNILFMGRVDYQIKIRGFRVELGEIEAVLTALEGVSEAAVIYKAHPEPTLIAYMVPGHGEVTAADIRTKLKETVPNYMVPGRLLFLEKMPLSPSGKIDRQALPRPESLQQTQDIQYVAPETELQKKLVGIWQTLLNREPVGIHDNFFDLGGHSLLVTRLSAAIAEAMDLELPIKTLFELPTIHELARFIEAALWSSTSTSEEADDDEAYEEDELI